MRSAALALSALLLAHAAPASAQGVRGLGLFAGDSESRLLRRQEPASDARTGLLVGAWVDASLPASRWSVLAEGGYVERGGEYATAGDTPAVVQSDFFEVTLAPTLHLDVAFVGAYAYGGPTLEVPLRTRTSTELEPAFRDPAGQVFSFTAGGGVELRLPETYAFRLEFRHVEGLSPAYRNDLGDFRYRATEILVRVGRSRP